MTNIENSDQQFLQVYRVDCSNKNHLKYSRDQTHKGELIFYFDYCNTLNKLKLRNQTTK